MEAADPNDLSAAEAAAQRLRIDYASAEVLRAFEAEGIPSIVLKGAAVVRWLYEPSERRAYLDCDLLVAPDSFASAGQILAGLGFRPELEEAEMPAWWREHGLGWTRASDGAAVDLHRSLVGAGAPPERVWEVLSRRTNPLDLAGFQARSLDPAGLVLSLALHLAQHAGLDSRVRELERALARTDEQTWHDAAQLARELDASAALRAGLSFLPSGEAIAEQLGLPADPSVEVLLRAEGSADALTVERFAQARPIDRVAIIWHKVFPPATFMRKWSAAARRGRAGLVAAYVWRPVWLLWRAPAAVRRWRSARRTARAGSETS